jgi:hypothetical protein
MILADIVPPDRPHSAEQAAFVLEKSGRQVLRYLESGALRGSKASGRWSVTALQIWQFQGIAEEMMENWRTYCLSIPEPEITHQKQVDNEAGE